MQEDYEFISNLSAQVASLPADSILSQTLLDRPELKVVLFAFAAGQELSAHTSAWPAVLHVIAGAGALTLGGDEYEVQPGAWSFMPARLEHSIQATEDLQMVLYMLKG